MTPLSPPLSGPHRQYPQLPNEAKVPERPISFVVVRFSDDFLHNFQRSECIHDPINEVIEVNNTGNLQFENLTAAMAHGVRQARHDLVAVVHEDVLLVPGWQSRFERSLAALEHADANWGLAGSVGRDHQGRTRGHWSDPYVYQNDFERSVQPWLPVDHLDEQLLVFHRHRLPPLDEHQPGIHLIGRHLSLELVHLGFATYALDAPTIHKYADQSGRAIHGPDQSTKIVDRMSLTYRADMQACIDYFNRKWPEHRLHDAIPPVSMPASFISQRLEDLDQPIIALFRGGSDSRLASALLQDAGVFMGNEVNDSGDAQEMALPIYQGIVEKYRGHAHWQKRQIVPRLRAAAAGLLASCAPGRPWGFRIPESVLLLPELRQAFPRARYLHLLRDPIATCLRRSDLTARMDNHIGRIALAEAYAFAGRPGKYILSDSDALRMACTAIHQSGLFEEWSGQQAPGALLELRFEQLLQDPHGATARLCAWLGLHTTGQQLESVIDLQRAHQPDERVSEDIERQVRALLQPLRSRLGYLE